MRHGFTTLSRDAPHLTIVKGASILKIVNTKSESSKQGDIKMVTLQDAKPFGILNKSDVISDVSLINESLYKVKAFADSSDPNPFYWGFFDRARRDEDKDGYIYEFGGYCGFLRYRVTRTDILKWALNNTEICCAAPEILNECLCKQRSDWFIVDYAAHIAELCYCDLARWVGMKHLSDFVAHHVYCVAAAVSDMAYSVKNSNELRGLYHKMRDMSESINDGYSMEELRRIAKDAASAFDEVFRIVK